jgi:hypothetical protein
MAMPASSAGEIENTSENGWCHIGDLMGQDERSVSWFMCRKEDPDVTQEVFPFTMMPGRLRLRLSRMA